MASYITRNRNDVLRNALQKLQKTTPITSIGPGSVARSLAEAVTNEIGDLYAIMDFNTSMSLVSSASGRALDLIAELYSVKRKELGPVAALDQSIGSFYFYLNAPYSSDIVIPEGTRVFNDSENFIGDQFTYITTRAVTIPAGRTKVYATIKPDFFDSVFTAGANTITRHSYVHAEATVLCTNPKAISPQSGYETDENFRQRIIKAVRTSAGGTDEAIRFTGLSVPGVREVRMRPLPYGLGSTEALVVPEETDIAVRVMAEVIEKMQQVRPAGVRLFVREPDYTKMDVHATIVLRSDVSVDSEGTKRRAEISIMRYLNTLLPGDPLIFTRLVQSILDASDAIADVVITRMRISGQEILRRNYRPESDQQLIPGDIQVATGSGAE